VGDIVWIEETKPLSKQKRWLLVDKAGAAKG
jgi:ribosomal protein S17